VTAGSTARVKSNARDLEDSDAVHALARLGLGARSVVWLVIGLLALSVALGGSEQTDQGGALRAVADQPFGRVLLVVLAVGFAGHGLWRLLNAAVGSRTERDAKKKWASRGASLARGLVYLSLCAATVRFLVQGSSQDQTQSLTARLMSATGGRTLVGVIGLVVIGIGIAMAVKGVTHDHADELETGRMPAGLRRPAIKIGVVGLLGRGAVFALIGLFLVRAAVEVDPAEAKGLDAVLQTVAGQPYGRVLLGLAVLGILAYAVWSFVEALYKRL
jgi:Domain of Unknown Function (DUF1206)